MEEVCSGSGIAASLAAELNPILGCRFYTKDLGHRFVPHGSLKELYHYCGVDVDSLVRFAAEVIHNEN